MNHVERFRAWMKGKKVNGIFLLVSFVCLMVGRGKAATGSITVNPHHLVIEPGSFGTATVTCSATGCTTTQVSAAMDGGSETLMSQTGTNGSVSPAWIQSEKIYVIKLYEGTSHTTLLDRVSVKSHRPPDNMYDHAGAPMGKRGLSLLFSSADPACAAENLGNRRLDYAAFHCYYPDGSNHSLTSGDASVSASFSAMHGSTWATSVCSTDSTCLSRRLQQGSNK
jgi:hypothetical protein